MINVKINPDRVTGSRDLMIYGQFIEHFHRQIYGGIYCPGSSLSDEKGFRKDVIEALRKIVSPIIRWPGGCFVSSYHWKDGVGKRKKVFDKAWRVEEPNTFGTDEFVNFCRLLGSKPYICTNAGTGTAEEMSDWVEYCNLADEGMYAKMRVDNGYPDAFNVKYWSIGNENYGAWEIGAKTADEWALLVTESAKMMKRADPQIEISAAALPDVNWNLTLLSKAGDYLDWISIHEYWDFPTVAGELSNYEQAIALTGRLDNSIRKTEGILSATGYIDKIKISFDEWNLRSWFHPHAHTTVLSADKERYLAPRDKNDDNSAYTMADVVFTGCFLNTLLRHSDTVKMANFSPAVNTRGLIFTHPNGIVLRGTYHVFDLFVNDMGEDIVDLWQQDDAIMSVADKFGVKCMVPQLDMVATRKPCGGIAVSIINKSPTESAELKLSLDGDVYKKWLLKSVKGNGVDDYNDVDRPENIRIISSEVEVSPNGVSVTIPPHSVNVLQTPMFH